MNNKVLHKFSCFKFSVHKKKTCMFGVIIHNYQKIFMAMNIRDGYGNPNIKVYKIKIRIRNIVTFRKGKFMLFREKFYKFVQSPNGLGAPSL